MSDGPSERFRVAVAQPRYGNPDAGARDAYWLCSDGTLCDVITRYSPVASATANCFNIALAAALDARDEGRITHFAMIHDDVCPQPGYRWLDQLADEMIRFDLDFVSAMVPIKVDEPDVPTSAAVAPAAWPEAEIRRIRMSDRARQPETFPASHVCGDGEILLLNTGLWLADLRHPAWDSFPGFTISTWIDKGPDGKRRNRMAPEDWLLSKHLQAEGARVGATWAVPLHHAGAGRWANR